MPWYPMSISKAPHSPHWLPGQIPASTQMESPDEALETRRGPWPLNIRGTPMAQDNMAQLFI